MSDIDGRLEELRGRINQLDDVIIDALEQRAKIVGTVAQIKAKTQMPIYCPAREAEVIDRAKRRCRYLSSEHVTTIFLSVFSVMRSLQERGRRPDSEEWSVEKTETAAILRTASGTVLLALKPEHAGQLERVAERHDKERR